MNINIQTIPHQGHRYETVGDYWYTLPSHMEIRVSSLEDEDYEFLIMIHEMIEAHLCRRRGIEEPLIKEYDEKFEHARVEGNTEEPGDQPEAPYHKEHVFATRIERLVAAELGVNWETYSAAVEAL